MTVTPPPTTSGEQGDRLAQVDLPLLVRDLMTPDPVVVDPAATVRDIAQLLLDHDIRSVPVIDIGGALVGVVSEADLLCREGYPTVRSHHLAGLIDHAVAEHRHHWTARAEGLTAGEIMTTEVVTCRPDEVIPAVSRRMLEKEVRTLPVVDGGRLVGVLSRHDLVRLFDRPDSEIRRRIDRLLSSPLWVPEDHAVATEVRDGVVILTGTVHYRSDAHVVSDMVRHVPGVLEVVNRVQWQEEDPKPSYLHDTDWR
jgi:CBS domain-containing protein